jgi:hypothetical protein
MATARIYPRQPLGSPVHQHRRAGWVVEFSTDRPRRADPLTGWAGGSETQSQVTLHFDERDEAVAYCREAAWDYIIQEDPPHSLKLQSYADNFR